MGSLPFSTKTKDNNIRVKIQESKPAIRPNNSRYDDEIDDQLWSLATKY